MSRFNRSGSAALALVIVSATSAPCFAAPAKGAKASGKSSAGAATPAPVAAAPAGPPALADSLKGDAKAEYESGKLLYVDGDYPGARVKFQAAYDTSQDPRLLWNMAACEKGMRHYAKVVELVRKYLASPGDVVTGDDRKDAQELMNAIESFTVGLMITVNEADAQVVIDDEVVGKSPLPAPVTVDIGTRRVEVKKPGFVPYLQSFPVGGSKGAALSVVLVPEVHQGELTISAPRDATILLDGVRKGMGRFVGSLPSGGHTLRVEAPGMRPYQSEVVVQDHEKRGVEVVLEPNAAPVAAPHQEVGPLHDMEIGLRMGIGSMTTRVRAANESDYRDRSVSFIPVGFNIGYRLGRPTYLGIYGQYGLLDKSNTCGIARHGPDPANPGDTAVRYGYSSCSMVKAGIELVFHVLPRTIIDPYFGFDVGIQGTFARYQRYDPSPPGVKSSGRDDNAALQPGLQLGVDAHPLPGFAAGLFAQGGPDIGGEGQPKDDNQNTSASCQAGSLTPCNTSCPNGQSCNSGSDAKVGQHFLFGVRVAYTFQ